MSAIALDHLLLQLPLLRMYNDAGLALANCIFLIFCSNTVAHRNESLILCIA